MQQTMRKITCMILVLSLGYFWPATAHAQAETTPDEYKPSNMARVDRAPAAKTEFEGHFSLPFEAQCHGHKLAPGQYTLMVKTVGTDKMVTLQREGSDVVLQSRPVPPTSVSD